MNGWVKSDPVREPQEVGYFIGAGRKSPPIRCMDVLDSFPCLTCGAGLNGANLVCRNHSQREADSAAYQAWSLKSQGAA